MQRRRDEAPRRDKIGRASRIASAYISGEVTYITRPEPPASSVTLVLKPDPTATTLAASLGWGSAIPDAQVSVAPPDSSAVPLTLMSSATGEVTLPDLAPGTYRWGVERMWC